MNNFELEITSKAYSDIEVILDYISSDNKVAAHKMIKYLFKSFDFLCAHPNLGKNRPDFTYLDVKFMLLRNII